MKRIKKVFSLRALLMGLLLLTPVFNSCFSTGVSGSSKKYASAPAQPRQGGQIPNVPVATPELFEFKIIGESPNKTITLTKYLGTSEAVRIPDRINDVPVTVIGSGSFQGKKIHTIIIPKGVITIGDQVVELSPNNDSLVTIVLPESVTSVGMMGFDTSTESVLETMRRGVVPFSVKIIIGANVKLAPDVYPELKDTPTFPLAFDSFYIRNGKKTGIYTIQKNTGSWRYSIN